jgi:uncharacterized protein (DUF433 family)
MIQSRRASLVHDLVTSDPEILDGTPVIKGTRVLVYDLAACVTAGISRDRTLAAYHTIEEHHLDVPVAYAKANPLQRQTRRFPTVAGATLVRSEQIPRRKG